MSEIDPTGNQAQERPERRIARFWEESRPLLLIADPLPDAPQILLEFCRKHGIRTEVVVSGAAALIAFGRTRPDVVVVSERLTDVPWQVLARAVSADAAGSIPVLVALDKNGAPPEEPIGSWHLEETLDGYTGAASSPVLKRLAIRGDGPSLRDAELVYGSLIMRPAEFEVRDNGESVPLTLREFELLRVLMLADGRAVPLEHLKSEVWGAVGEVVKTETLKVHMGRLRHKLPGRVRPVAVRGVGYRLKIM